MATLHPALVRAFPASPAPVHQLPVAPPPIAPAAPTAGTACQQLSTAQTEVLLALRAGAFGTRSHWVAQLLDDAVAPGGGYSFALHLRHGEAWSCCACKAQNTLPSSTCHKCERQVADHYATSWVPNTTGHGFIPQFGRSGAPEVVIVAPAQAQRRKRKNRAAAAAVTEQLVKKEVRKEMAQAVRPARHHDVAKLTRGVERLKVDPPRQRKQATPAQRELAMNGYLATLVDPVNVKGQRIPDSSTIPTSTFSVKVQGEMNNYSSGGTGWLDTCAVTFGGGFGSDANSDVNRLSSATMLVPDRVQGVVVTDASGTVGYDISDGPNTYAMGYTGAGTNDKGVFASGLVVAPNAGLIYNPSWNSTQASIPGIGTQVRLVSATLMVCSTNTQNTNAGRLIGVSMGRLTTFAMDDSALTPSYFENRGGARSIPINQNTPINVLYQPQDPLSLSYAPLANSSNDQGGLFYPGGGSTSGPITTIDGSIQTMSSPTDFALRCPGELWVIATGLTGPESFWYTFVGNYEIVPNETATALLDARVSKSDPLAMAHAQNRMSNMSTVVTGSEWLAPAAAAPPIAHHRAEERPGIMDSLISGAKGLWDDAGGWAGVSKMALSALEMAL